MPDHDHVRSGGDAGDERLEILLPQARQCLIDRGSAVVRVGGCAAVAGEVLQAADDAPVVKALDGGGDKRGRLVIVVAVCAVADGIAALVRPDVGHGRKVRVEAVGGDVARDGLRVVVRALRALRAVAVHAAELRRADGVHQPRDTAALLVDRDERRRFAPVRKRGGERCELLAGGHILRREQHAADRVGTQRSGELVRHVRDGAAARERLGVYDQQLADLFVRGHAVQQRLCRIPAHLGRGARRRGRLRGILPAADAQGHEHRRQHREHEQTDERAPVSLCSCPEIVSVHASILPQRRQKRNAVSSTRRTCFVHNYVL